MKLQTVNTAAVLIGYRDENLWPHSAVVMGYSRDKIAAMIQTYTGSSEPVDFNAPQWGLTRREYWRHSPDKGWALCGPRGVVTEERGTS